MHRALEPPRALSPYTGASHGGGPAARHRGRRPHSAGSSSAVGVDDRGRRRNDREGSAWRRGGACARGARSRARGWWKLRGRRSVPSSALVIVAAGLGSRRTRSSACSPSWSPSWSPGSVCCWASSVSSDGVHERCRHHIATARRRRVRSLLRRRTARSAGHVGPVIRVHPRRLSTTNLVRSAGAPPSSHAAAGAADARRRGGRWVHARRHRSRLDAPDRRGPEVHVDRHHLHRRLHHLRPRPIHRRRGPRPSPTAGRGSTIVQSFRCGRDACRCSPPPVRSMMPTVVGGGLAIGAHGVAADHFRVLCLVVGDAVPRCCSSATTFVGSFGWPLRTGRRVGRDCSPIYTTDRLGHPPHTFAAQPDGWKLPPERKRSQPSPSRQPTGAVARLRRRLPLASGTRRR